MIGKGVSDVGRAHDGADRPGTPAATAQVGSATQSVAQLVLVVSVPTTLLSLTIIDTVGMSADEVLRRAVERVATVAGHRLAVSVEILNPEETLSLVARLPRSA